MDEGEVGCDWMWRVEGNSLVMANRKDENFLMWIDLLIANLIPVRKDFILTVNFNSVDVVPRPPYPVIYPPLSSPSSTFPRPFRFCIIKYYKGGGGKDIYANSIRFNFVGDWFEKSLTIDPSQNYSDSWNLIVKKYWNYNVKRKKKYKNERKNKCTLLRSQLDRYMHTSRSMNNLTL